MDIVPMEVLVEDDGVIRLPTDVLESLGMTVGSKLVCSAEGHRLVIYPPNGYTPETEDGTSPAHASPVPSPPDGLVEDGQLVKRRRADGAVAVPKRNISAYHLFAKHVTKQLLAEKPDMDVHTRNAIILERWKQLPQQYKQQYEDAAAADKARYAAEMLHYRQLEDDRQYEQSTLWNGETNGMVPSLGAHTTQTPYAPPGTVAVQSLFGKYMNPADDARQRDAALNGDAVPWIGGDMERSSSFTDMHAVAQTSLMDRRSRSERSLNDHLPEASPKSRYRWTDGLPVPRSVLSRTPRKPMTAYNVFYKVAYAELSAQHPEATLSQLSQMCSDRWKSLSEEAKRTYYDAASADRARYRQELLDYQNGRAALISLAAASAAHQRHLGQTVDDYDDD